MFTGVSLTNGDGYYALGTIDSTNSPLPIELLSFDAHLDDAKVVLSWSTASETNNDFFSIERSSDANNWEAIQKVQGQGNSNELHNYSTIDKNPMQGTSYYRLKQTDFDGKYSYSQIRVINNYNNTIQVYPNPVTDELYIETQDDIIEIWAFDQLGKRYKIQVQKENNVYKTNLSRLSSGVYYLQIITPDRIIRQKVIKK